MDDLDTKLARERDDLVSKVYSLIDNLLVRAGALDAAPLEVAADLLPLMAGPVSDTEVAVRKLETLLQRPSDPIGATVRPRGPKS